MPRPLHRLAATLGAVLALSGCAPPDTIPTLPRPAAASTATAPPDLAAAEQAAYERARPVFEKHCRRCHASAGEKASTKALGHFSIDRYPFGGHHTATAGAAVREVLGVGGEAASMPADDPGAVTGAELDAIVAWSKAFDAAHPPAAPTPAPDGHQGHDDHDD